MYRADTLPDVTSHTLQDNLLPLQWVGMEHISVPITLALRTDTKFTSVADASIYVSINDTAAKGIHMSRLHAILNEFSDRVCSKATVDHMLDEAIESQSGLSDNAKIELGFDLLLEKPALVSGESGYQAYPVTICADSTGGKRNYAIGLTIPYSSTCPCSASLSRQLVAHAVDRQFAGEMIDKASLLDWIQSERGSVATPHAQRSYAYIKLETGDNPWPELDVLVPELEAVIGTPVQTAVKRVDEQQFARLNAENLMFCEDAARRIKLHLQQMPSVTDYWLKVEHQESLHAHNAVVIDQK